MNMTRCAIMTCIVLLVQYYTRAAQPQLTDVNMLTIEESVGLSYYEYMQTPSNDEVIRKNELLIIAMQHANPGAKVYFRKMIFSEQMKAYHYQIIMLLGYIGDGEASDVECIRRYLLQGISGELDDIGKNKIRYSSYALRMLSRNGVKSATECLRDMCTKQFWDQAKFTYPKKGEDRFQVNVWNLIDVSIRDYAASGASDWRSIAESINEMVKQGKITKGIDINETEQYASAVKDNEKMFLKNIEDKKKIPVEPKYREELMAAYNKNSKTLRKIMQSEK